MYWETATLKASEPEMQALIKSCNMPQTRSKSTKNKKVTEVCIVETWKL